MDQHTAMALRQTLNRLGRLFTITPAPKSEADVARDNAALVKRLVRRYGHDLALVQGRYATEEDIAARREAVLNHRFI